VIGVGLQWVQVPPGNWVAPAGSYRSGGGGNETVEASETNVLCKQGGEPTGRNASERRAGLETTDVDADPAFKGGRPLSLEERETGGIGRPMSDSIPASHRGNDDGMSAHGDQRNTGNPRRWGRVTPNRTPARDRPGRRGWRRGS